MVTAGPPPTISKPGPRGHPLDALGDRQPPGGGQMTTAEVEPGTPGSGPAPAGPVRVLFIGGLGRSGSTLLDRMLGRLNDVCSVGELVHLWERGLKENNRCGCGERFGDCPFWRRVGQVAFGGWDTVDVHEILALKASVDRNRFVPLMVLPALRPAYRGRLDRYLDLLERLYAAVREVSGRPSWSTPASTPPPPSWSAVCAGSTCALSTWSATAAGSPSPGPSGCGRPRQSPTTPSWRLTPRYA